MPSNVRKAWAFGMLDKFYFGLRPVSGRRPES